MRIGLRTQRKVSDLRRYWSVMTLAERFEQLVASVLGVVIAIVILMALWELIRQIVLILYVQHAQVLDHKVFQNIFGGIMTLLIALEFQHSIIKVIDRRDHIIQTKIVILIAMLAITRKFIIMDSMSKDAWMVIALAVAILAMGVVYWLIDQRNQRQAEWESARQESGRNDARPS